MNLRPEWMVGGRKWTFEADGRSFEIVSWNGVDSVQLYYRRSGELRHSRPIKGHGAHFIAQQIYEDVLARNGKV